MNQYYHYAPAQQPPPLHYQAAFQHYRKPLRRYANIIGGGLFLLQVIMFVVLMILHLAFSFLDSTALQPALLDLLDESLNLVSYSLAFWLVTLLIVTLVGIPAKVAFPLRAPRKDLWIPAVFVTLGVSVIGGFFSSVLSVFLQAVTGYMPYMPEMTMPEGFAANAVYVFSVAFAPAIFEELLFRGAILQTLRRFGDGFALVASSILFALTHGNLVQIPNAMLMGLVIGYFVLRTGSVLTGMILHFVNNGMVVLIGYLEPFLPMAQADSLYLTLYGGYLLLGATALTFLMVRKGNMFRLIPPADPFPTRKKYTAFFTAIVMLLYVIGIVLMTLYFFE